MCAVWCSSPECSAQVRALRSSPAARVAHPSAWNSAESYDVCVIYRRRDGVNLNYCRIRRRSRCAASTVAAAVTLGRRSAEFLACSTDRWSLRADGKSWKHKKEEKSGRILMKTRMESIFRWITRGLTLQLRRLAFARGRHMLQWVDQWQL